MPSKETLAASDSSHEYGYGMAVQSNRQPRVDGFNTDLRFVTNHAAEDANTHGEVFNGRKIHQPQYWRRLKRRFPSGEDQTVGLRQVERNFSIGVQRCVEEFWKREDHLLSRKQILEATLGK